MASASLTAPPVTSAPSSVPPPLSPWAELHARLLARCGGVPTRGLSRAIDIVQARDWQSLLLDIRSYTVRLHAAAAKQAVYRDTFPVLGDGPSDGAHGSKKGKRKILPRRIDVTPVAGAAAGAETPRDAKLQPPRHEPRAATADERGRTGEEAREGPEPDTGALPAASGSARTHPPAAVGTENLALVVALASIHAGILTDEFEGRPLESLGDATALGELQEVARLNAIVGDAPNAIPEGSWLEALNWQAARTLYIRKFLGELGSNSPFLALLPTHVLAAWCDSPVAGPELAAPSSPTSFYADGLIESHGWCLSPARFTQPPVRLVSNLEASWDRLLSLYSKFMGAQSNARPGHLVVDDVHWIRENLHPANYDGFAARVLEKLADSCSPTDNPKQDLMERRLSKPVAPAVKPQKSAGVVLHRVPDRVRVHFAKNQTELFFFSLFESLDSAKLNVAMASRLTSAIHESFSLAQRSGENGFLRPFRAGLVRTRMAAKFLAQLNYNAGWANSAAAVEGESQSNTPVYPLHDESLIGRMAQMEALWTAQINLPDILCESVENGTCFPTLVWCLPFLEIASADPVALSTSWFRKAHGTIVSIYKTVSADLQSQPSLSQRIGKTIVYFMTEEHLSRLNLWDMSDTKDVENDVPLRRVIRGVDDCTDLLLDPTVIDLALPELRVVERLLSHKTNSSIAPSRRQADATRRRVPTTPLSYAPDLDPRTTPLLHSKLLHEMFQRETPNFFELVRMSIQTSINLHPNDSDAAATHARGLVKDCVGALLGNTVSTTKIRVAAEFAATSASQSVPTQSINDSNHKSESKKPEIGSPV